jgi:hypothetical protein
VYGPHNSGGVLAASSFRSCCKCCVYIANVIKVTPVAVYNLLTAVMSNRPRQLSFVFRDVAWMEGRKMERTRQRKTETK